jgi:hypothetical protein
MAIVEPPDHALDRIEQWLRGDRSLCGERGGTNDQIQLIHKCVRR